MAGRPELLERIERRTSVKRSSEKEENGQADHSRLLKLSKTAEQVELLTRENKKLNEELTKVKQESSWNEQLVKQFLLELKAAKQRQREMQEREEKLLSVLRDMAVGGGSTMAEHMTKSSTTSSNFRVQEPRPNSHQEMQHSREELDSQLTDNDFDLVEAYMLKLGLSTRDAVSGGHEPSHQHQGYNPPSPFQAPQVHTFSTPPASPQTTASHSYAHVPSTPPQSPFQPWTAAPASPSAFFFGSETADQVS